ncbi:succinate--CoA ligase subunit alpha [Gulosibacter bifidus]|uniref:Succinate--CoA ligase [ADP-forming] subunit alpha n=1 Tax=Gulosibacter bifidus TaxID=272239 RepID=A0ABW5RJ18_9MICO|nr:succinate--CoA ligase subunit alpha [Gulosibacter bifidus]
MSIYLDRDSVIIIQGITGAEGRKHAQRMLAAGSNVVGGTHPKKGGQTVTIAGRELPIFESVDAAMRATGANVSVVFVPPAQAKAAMLEAAEARIPLLVVITEGIPVNDTVDALARIRELGATRMIGPNCPGIISPDAALAGITPASICGSGPVGVVSKSGTLTYQIMHELRDLGVSTAIGIGGDPVIGTTHIDALEAFERDPDTRAMVLIGEIGGAAEERAAEYIAEHITKPVVAYVAGFSAPEGKTMGHAGAIVSGSESTAQAKKAALEAVGVRVGETTAETAALLRDLLADN